MGWPSYSWPLVTAEVILCSSSGWWWWLSWWGSERSSQHGKDGEDDEEWHDHTDDRGSLIIRVGVKVYKYMLIVAPTLRNLTTKKDIFWEKDALLLLLLSVNAFWVSVPCWLWTPRWTFKCTSVHNQQRYEGKRQICSNIEWWCWCWRCNMPTSIFFPIM